MNFIASKCGKSVELEHPPQTERVPTAGVCPQNFIRRIRIPIACSNGKSKYCDRPALAVMAYQPLALSVSRMNVYSNGWRLRLRPHLLPHLYPVPHESLKRPLDTSAIFLTPTYLFLSCV